MTLGYALFNGTNLPLNTIQNWATYFNFGDESFRRIPDPVGRREVSVFFALELSKIDVGAFKVNTKLLLASQQLTHSLGQPERDGRNLVRHCHVANNFGAASAYWRSAQRATKR